MNEQLDGTTGTVPANGRAEMTGPPPHLARPRVVLMGEFSAGKSSLINLMLGRELLPTRVTATRLPPVWLAFGAAPPFREDLSGNRFAVNLAGLEDVPFETTAFLRLFLDAEILRHCDLIDTPGLSDPNTPADVYERAARQADSILFLTHATQAWRQSEAAVWAGIPPQIQRRSLLIVTRMDKLTRAFDRERMLARVRAETFGQFADVLPMSLTEAQAAGDSDAFWEASGGAGFSAAFLRCLDQLIRAARSRDGLAPTSGGRKG